MRTKRQPVILAAIFAFPLLPMKSNAAILVNPPVPIDYQITLNLIDTFTTDGTQRATTFGDAFQQSYIEDQVNSVWAQAGIQVNFSSSYVPYYNDFAYDGSPNNYSISSGNIRPSSEFDTLLFAGDLAGVGSPDPSVIDVYFVDIVPGWTEQGPVFTNGWGRINGGGIAYYVGTDMLLTPENRDLIAAVFAHEIGHNLGLEHLDTSNNLMNSAVYYGYLNPTQIDLVRSNSSNLLQAIPEPSVSLLLLSGGAFTFPKRRRPRPTDRPRESGSCAGGGTRGPASGSKLDPRPGKCTLRPR